MEIAIFSGDLDPDLPSLFQGMSVQRFTQIFKELIAYGQYQVEVTTKIDPTLKNQVITRQREIIPVVRFFFPAQTSKCLRLFQDEDHETLHTF